MADHPYREAGRRLKAALVSYQLGRAGVDRTLKETPEDPGEGWAELAERLLTEMMLNIDKPFNPSCSDPSGGGPRAVQ
ncbi:MAG: hypothetical protein ACRD3N_17285 [Terracidiphilus sp.]